LRSGDEGKDRVLVESTIIEEDVVRFVVVLEQTAQSLCGIVCMASKSSWRQGGRRKARRCGEERVKGVGRRGRHLRGGSRCLWVMGEEPEDSIYIAARENGRRTIISYKLSCHVFFRRTPGSTPWQ
jgi:hypothetical protein